MKNLKIVSLFLLTILLSSCNRDDGRLTTPQVIETPAEQNARIAALISSTSITTDLIVSTVDQFGNFLPDVNITIDNTIYSSGTISRAIIEDVTVNDAYVFITAEKAGYERVMKTITPSKNGLTNVELMLLIDVPSKTLNATTGGTITLGNIILDFPANSIKNTSGNPYTGSVDVNMVYYDPTDINFAQTQPGTLVGVTETDEIKALVSEGMLTVDLTDGSGNPLNIADNKTIKITMPASSGGPATIPFWHLNETHGIWVEQGLATKVGNTYEYEVSHFSTYNLDWKVNPLDFCVKFKDQNGNVISNQSGQFTSSNVWNPAFMTDNLGEMCFLNGAQGNYTFKIDIGCAMITSTINITTSGTHDIIFDLSTVTSTPTLTNYNFTGLLYTCSNVLAINKPFSLEIDDNGIKHYLNGVSDQNGAYSFNKALCLSPIAYPARLYIYDTNALLENNFNIDLNNSNIDLSACNPITNINNNTLIYFPDINFYNGILNEIFTQVATPSFPFTNHFIPYSDLSGPIQAGTLQAISV